MFDYFNGMPWLSTAFIMVSFLLILLILSIAAYYGYNKYKNYMRLKNGISHPGPLPKNPGDIHLKSDEYETILKSIDLGVISFDQFNRLFFFNEASVKMLGQDTLNFDNLDEFLTLFCTDNGIKAGYILGKKNSSGFYLHDDTAIMIYLRVIQLSNSKKITTVITYDMTDRINLEKQRKQFVSNVSHELKTPLTTIITYAESLLDWGLNELTIDDVRGDIQRVYSDAKRMQSLVNDLSLLTALDSNGIRPRMEDIDIVHLVKFCAESLTLAAKEKQIIIDVQYPPNIPLVFGERTSIDRIFRNLIENAIKYTNKGGYILITINYVHEEIFIKVKDNGIGIKKDALPYIFDRFYRVDNSGSSLFGGTGLGLSIAKELVELHNGRITVSSTLGSGTEFIVFLPVAEKIIREALDSKCDPGNDIVLQVACDYVLEQATEIDSSIYNLSDINDEVRDKILSRYNIDITT